MDHQVARFRGDSSGAEILVLARSPFSEDPDSVVEGVTLLDSQFRRVARWRDLPREPGLRVRFTGLKPGAYNVVAEALVGRSLSQARDTVSITPTTDRLSMSDMLLVDAVTGPAATQCREDLAISWLYGTTLDSSSSLGFVWEIYAGDRHASEVREYGIVVEIRDATDRSVLARIARSIGRGFRREDPTTTLRYTRTVPGDADRSVEWVNIDAEWQPGGSYVVTVTVTDPRTGDTTSGARRFRIGPESQARD